jgi:hypothetical protein
MLVRYLAEQAIEAGVPARVGSLASDELAGEIASALSIHVTEKSHKLITDLWTTLDADGWCLTITMIQLCLALAYRLPCAVFGTCIQAFMLCLALAYRLPCAVFSTCIQAPMRCV